jgi:2-methylisocitrate lyase-like PEP mutase family enzyme
MIEKFTRLRKQLRKLIDEDHRLVAPGVYDALSATLAQATGFPLIYAGSYAIAAARGLPDVGLLSIDEVISAVGLIANAVDIPVIVDAENGFHEPANLWRTMRAYEQAGVAGIHIDDHVSGKHSSMPRRTLSLDDLRCNLKAALDSRSDPDFLVIGRTDIAWATGDLQETVRRLTAMLDTGVDLVFPVGLSPAQLADIRKKIPGRLMIVHTDNLLEHPVRDASITVHHTCTLYAAAQAVMQVLHALKQRNLDDVRRLSMSAVAFEHILPFASYDVRGHAYRALKETLKKHDV